MYKLATSIDHKHYFGYIANTTSTFIAGVVTGLEN